MGSTSGGTGSGAVFSLFFTGELAAQWYAIDVSSGTPTFQKVGGVDNVGHVAFGANTYAFEPAIDINSQGQIGFGFMESDTIGGAITPATGGFISTFVTVRQPTDPAGTMQAPVLVSAGTGSAPITSRIGDFSGMNVDPSNNTFWHVNEFGGGGPTVIANFTPDAAPLLTPPGAQAVVEGASKTFNLGSFADPDGGPWTVDVNWGDGSPDTIFNVTAPGTIPPKAHTYVEEGFYAGTITVTDTSNGQFDSKLFSIVTADADLTAGVPVALVANTGVALPAATVVGRFTDANLSAPDPDGDFLTTIDWGDGSPLTTGIVVQTGPGAFEIEGGHSYAKPGNYATKISVHDDGGETVLVTGTAAITDLPVTGSTLSFKTIEGQPTGTFALATFEDPNTLATVADVKAELAVNGWGDGTPVAPGGLLPIQQIGVDTANGQPIFQVLGTHTYAEETPTGVPDRLSVVITTLGGATTTLTSPIGGGVTVLDAKLTSSNGTSINGIEGNSTGSVLLGTFIDANQGATVADFTTSPGSVVINWGDGSAPQTLPAADLVAMGAPDGVIFSVNAAHTYAEAGTYAYTVTVADDGGSNTVFSGTAFIADADLKATPTQPPVFTAEAAIFPIPVFTPPVFVGAVGTFTDANPLGTIADFKAMIDWGDGTPLTAGTLTVSQGTPVFTVSGSHTYADAGVNGGNGTYTIQVFVEDDDGKRLTITNTATVADRPIVLTGTINPLTVSGLATGAVNVTNVNQPEFFGKSEPFSTVTLDARLLPGGPLVQIGQAHAGGDGSWDIKSQIALADGHFAITATAIDQFGETTSTAPKVIVPDLLIDTVGPVIDGMFFNHLNGQVDYIIKDPVNPDGSAPSGVWLNTMLDSSNYLLTKVHANKTFPGNYKVTNVTATPDPTIPFAYDVAVTINGGRALRGGFYLFTIRDSSNGNSSVQDRAQNHLDGVFYGSFSSGNSRNGSDFVAELDAYHDKVFAPQTLVGTASPANGGIGGLPVGGVYSGIHVPVIPKGGRPLFSTPTSPSSPVNSSGLFQRVNHRPAFASWTARGQFRFTTNLARASHASVVTGNHPKGPHHK
ncbi:PKD domain-containing protein [Singulisphaera sp. PoT]|uniref:PKD domain-containing protein n=1 Tax=Singulisphaera sp. PoT TaxID=3411797 RepID=UPI003BF54237